MTTSESNYLGCWLQNLLSLHCIWLQWAYLKHKLFFHLKAQNVTFCKTQKTTRTTATNIFIYTSCCPNDAHINISRFHIFMLTRLLRSETNFPTSFPPRLYDNLKCLGLTAFKGHISAKLLLQMDLWSGVEPKCRGKMKAGTCSISPFNDDATVKQQTLLPSRAH